MCRTYRKQDYIKNDYCLNKNHDKSCLEIGKHHLDTSKGNIFEV